MATHFTGCTHFGHHGIILSCRRPFADAAEMDEALVAGWNARVGRRDDVWHLGDFGFVKNRAQADRMGEIFSRLNGHKRLVRGNHDHKHVLRMPWAESPVDYAEVEEEGTGFVLCHYPFASWRNMRRGMRHLYSHVHASMRGNSLSLDVGVDGWGFRPVTPAEALAAMARLPPVVFREEVERHDFRALLDAPAPEEDPADGEEPAAPSP